VGPTAGKKSLDERKPWEWARRELNQSTGTTSNENTKKARVEGKRPQDPNSKRKVHRLTTSKKRVCAEGKIVKGQSSGNSMKGEGSRNGRGKGGNV